ncbi:MAG: hypothetical protein ACRDHF_14405 [Tepidiformaceae bacterium]
MRTLVLLAFLAVAALIYFAVVLRLPSARGMLQFLLRAGWLWVAAIVIFGALEAYRRWL